MKQPTLSQFISQLKEMTSNLSSDKLQEIILKLGENTGKEERSEFVRTVTVHSDTPAIENLATDP
jgi:hypothetical protein